MTHPDIEAAAAWIRAHDESTLESQIELSEIPAPPFRETKRGERMLELFRVAGLSDPFVDPVGNVIADRPGTSHEPPLIVSAHLDTVFPPETDVSVTRVGDTLRGPGISDDARGLAALLAVARAMVASNVQTRAPVRFVATVGEEGAGDLRGVKHLFGADGDGRTAAGFISLDGAGLDRVVTRALGSRRYRIEVSGPGGHSWVDWGTPNPIHATAQLAAALTELPLSREPKTTLTIARMGGGKSINAIPQNAWIEVDSRSAGNSQLIDLEVRMREAVDRCADKNRDLAFAVHVIGERPGGETPVGAPLLRAALDATRRLGREPILALSSTDANIPMSMGIPALTLGCGGEAGMAHTTDEWYRNVDGPDGIVRALYTIAGAARAPGAAPAHPPQTHVARHPGGG
ncbi:MAG: M20/M25/M40 family metallo-hydrolase, partial [Gemmatimonadota bacterium]